VINTLLNCIINKTRNLVCWNRKFAIGLLVEPRYGVSLGMIFGNFVEGSNNGAGASVEGLLIMKQMFYSQFIYIP